MDSYLAFQWTYIHADEMQPADQTPDSAEGRIRHHFPDEAEQLLQKRHLFIK